MSSAVQCRSARPVSLWPGESSGRIAWRHGWQWTSRLPRSRGTSHDAMMPGARWKQLVKAHGGFTKINPEMWMMTLMVLNHVNNPCFAELFEWITLSSWWIMMNNPIVENNYSTNPASMILDKLSLGCHSNPCDSLDVWGWLRWTTKMTQAPYARSAHDRGSLARPEGNVTKMSEILAGAKMSGSLPTL